MRPLLLLTGFLIAIPLSLGADDNRLQVGVSVLPLESVVEDIGGPLVEVFSLQEEGDSCSVFEPRPSRIRLLAESSLFFRTGVGYESMLMDTVARQYPDLTMIDLRDGLELLPGQHVHGPHCLHEAEHGHAGHGHATDPHIWLDPVLLRHMGERVATALIEARPDEEGAIKQRLAGFLERLDTVHSRLSTLLKPADGKAFYIYHPALGYFAHRYNLRQVALGGDNDVPTLKKLRQHIHEARRDAVLTVFVQPQESRRQAEILARSVGASLAEINPMQRDWEENLLSIGQALASALVQD